MEGKMKSKIKVELMGISSISKLLMLAMVGSIYSTTMKNI
jgi:hypothetical protein